MQYSKHAKRPKLNYKIKLGWLLKTEDKYNQVREKTGGGPRESEFPGDANYDFLLQKAKDLFFPNGKITACMKIFGLCYN